MKLTYEQKLKIYQKLAKVKGFKNDLIIETLPQQGVWLGNDYYPLQTLVDAINKQYNTSYEV